MLVVDLVLVLCWTQVCGALLGRDLIPAQGDTMTGGHLTTSSTSGPAVPHQAPNLAPCFVDDILTALREGVGVDGELTNRSLTLFGICPSSATVVSVAKEMSRNPRLEVLHPTEVLMEDGEETGTLTLTFNLQRSPLHDLNRVLLLAFANPHNGGNLDIAITSRSLHPHTQSVCISDGTQYVMLSGRRRSEGHVHQKWVVSVKAKSADMGQSLKDILIGGKSGSMTPLLLVSGERGSDTRHTHVSGSSAATSSFLCELKRFLGDVLPQDHPTSPQLRLDSLNSLPPLTLGPSTGEILLSGLLNSSSPTVFSFAGWTSELQAHRGQLAMSPALLEEVRRRLERTAAQVGEVLRQEEEEEVEGEDRRAAKRLRRLRDLSAIPETMTAAGETQYCAFLLLKALQTVARGYEVQRGLRATRADPDTASRGEVCGLRSLTVSLERRLVGPNTANINNCQGSCAFPLVNTNNHAVLLNSHIESGNPGERAPCCVPVAYDSLEVVDLNEHGTYLSIKPDVLAKECGCR